MKWPGWSPLAWLLFDLQRTITLGYVRQRWSRAVLIVVSIALGVSILVATRILNQNLGKAAEGAISPLSGLADLLVLNGQSGIPVSVVDRLRDAQYAEQTDAAATVGLVALPGCGGPLLGASYLAVEHPAVPELRDVQPMIIGRVAIPELDNRSVLMFGLQPPRDLAAPEGTSVHSLGVHVDFTTKGLDLIQLLRDRHPVLLRKDLANDLGRQAERFHVCLAGKELEVGNVGTVNVLADAGGLEKDAVFLYADAAATLVYPHRPNFVTQININVRNPADLKKAQQRLQELVPVPCRVETLEITMANARDITAGLELAFMISGAGALVVGLFLVYNALSVSVAERRHDIGILRSVGATRGQIAWLFMIEAAGLGLVGSVLAIPLGYGLALLFAGPMTRAMNDLFVPTDAAQIVVGWRLMLIAVSAGVLTTVLAALVPALQAASEEPADAVRRVPMVIHFLYYVAQLTGSAVLIATGLLCVVFREYLPVRYGVFAGMVLILIGALVLTPLMSEVLGKFLQPFFRRVLGLVGRLAADNLVRSPGRTGFVIAALAATGAMMVMTSGFIASTEAAIFTWLDDKIAADLFVSAADPVTKGTTTLPMDEEIGDRLRQLPEVQAVVPVRTHMLEFRDRFIFLIAIDTDAFDDKLGDSRAQTPITRGLVEMVRAHPELRQPGTALISDNFAALYRVNPGEHISVAGLDCDLKLQVIGKVVDYSWNRGTIIVDRKWYREHYHDTQINLFDVYLRPGNDRDDVIREIESRWGKSDALRAVARDKARNVLGQQLAEVYGMAYAQEGVVGLVSLLGVISALSISVLQRRRELGLLRSIGATRAQVLNAVLAEAILMGIIGALLGFLIGLLLQWYLLDVALFDESGFVFPMRVPWTAGLVVIGL